MENENQKPTTRSRQQKIEDFLLNPDKEIFNSLQEFNDSVEYIKSLLGNLDLNDLEKIQGQDGKSPVLGVDYFTDEDLDKIDKFIQDRINVVWATYPTKAEISNQIESSVKREVAKIPQVKGEDGAPGKPGQNGSPDTAEQIIAKLRSLPKNQRLTVSDVRGLQNELNSIKQSQEDDFNSLQQLINSLRITVPVNGNSGGISEVNWGDIGGDILDQDDLVAILNTKLEDVAGLITAGANVNITGSGTAADPYVINAVGAGSGDVTGPEGAVSGNLAEYDGVTGKIIKDSSKKVSDFQTALGYTAENSANKSTSVSTDGASDIKYPSAKAVKDYADSLVAGLLDYRGAHDASGNAFPSTGGSGAAGVVLKGDMWVISVPGTLGGVAVQVGDSLIANVDTPGQTAGNWNVLNSNTSYVPEDVANKKTTMTGNEASGIFYLTAKAIYDWVTGLFTTHSATQTGVHGLAITAGKTLTVTDNASVTGANTGDQTNISGNAGTATKLAATKKINGVDFDGSADITILPRVVTATSYTTDTGTSLNCDTTDQFVITAQAGALKFNNPGGTPTEGAKLIIRIKDNGTARALTWDTQFRAMGNALPTTTVISKTMYCGLIFNATDTKWDLVSVTQEA